MRYMEQNRHTVFLKFSEKFFGKISLQSKIQRIFIIFIIFQNFWEKFFGKNFTRPNISRGLAGV
jgi:hypothetical protein